MPLGTRILVATLVLLFGAAVLYYGFVMAPADRAPLGQGGQDAADAAEDADAEVAARAGDRLVDPVTAAGMYVPGAGRTAASDPSDAAADRSQATRSARPLGIADPPGLPGRLMPPGSSAAPRRDDAPSTETVRSGGNGAAARGDVQSDSPSVGSASEKDQLAAPSPFAPATDTAGRSASESSPSSARARDPVRPTAPVTEAPKANEPLRVRERSTGGEPVPGLAREIMHEVVAGETLSSIAQRHYGSANRWEVIASANPDVDPNRLQIGQQLRVPPAAAGGGGRASSSASAPAGRASTPSAPAAARRGDAYVVLAGDTLSSISSQFYGTPNHWSRLHQANRDVIGADPDRLREGMTLHIPR